MRKSIFRAAPGNLPSASLLPLPWQANCLREGFMTKQPQERSSEQPEKASRREASLNSKAERPKRRILQISVALLAISFGGSNGLLAQSIRARTIDELDRAGFGFYDVSAFSGYSTTTGPAFNPLTNTVVPSSSYHSITTGISTSVGWRSRKSETLHFDLRYSPSYYYVTSSTGFSRSRFSPIQTLGLSWDKKFGTKWTATLSLSGSLGDFDQLLLLPTNAQNLSLLPGTTAVLSGASSTGAFGLITPQQSLYYGGRILTAAARTSLAYAMTPRLSIAFGVGAQRMQHLRNNNVPSQNPGLFQQSTGLNGNLALNYAVSPRTGFSANASYYRAISSLATIPSVSLMAGFSRSMTDQLIVNVSAGAGYVLPNATQGPSFQRTQIQAAGGITYRTRRQTFVAMVSRSASDNFGLGATATVNATGGWSWNPLQSKWGISAGAQDTWLQDVSFGTNGYSANVSISRTIRRRAYTSLGYGFGSYTREGFLGLATNVPVNYTSHSLRFSIGFSPYLGSPDAIGSVPTR
jgi:hypothetical protein